VLLESNVTAQTVELKVLNAKATPGFRLFAIPDPASCYAGAGDSGCDLILNTQYLGPAFRTTTTESVAA